MKERILIFGTALFVFGTAVMLAGIIGIIFQDILASFMALSVPGRIAAVGSVVAMVGFLAVVGAIGPPGIYGIPNPPQPPAPSEYTDTLTPSTCVRFRAEARNALNSPSRPPKLDSMRRRSRPWPGHEGVRRRPLWSLQATRRPRPAWRGTAPR